MPFLYFTHFSTIAEKADWYLSTAFPKEMTPVELQQQAEVCNSKKLSARLAGEESAELFFVLFVKVIGFSKNIYIYLF